MIEDNERIIKKVKGLLAIAKDEKNDEESQSAFILAQKLMIQYNIAKHEVEDFEVLNESEEINEESVTIYKRLYWWEHNLAGVISKNFRVKTFLNSKKIGKQEKRKIVFYGFGKDLELAKEMYILAYDALLYHSKQYIETYYDENVEELRSRYKTESIKASYIQGFLSGLSARFDEQVAALRESYEVLVLVPEEVEKSFKEMSSDWGHFSFENPPVEVTTAYDQGLSDGKEIDFTKSTISE